MALLGEALKKYQVRYVYMCIQIYKLIRYGLYKNEFDNMSKVRQNLAKFFKSIYNKIFLRNFTERIDK